MSNVPVLIGVGARTQRPVSRLEDAKSPIDLACEAVQDALGDAQIDQSAVDAVYFVDLLGELMLLGQQESSFTNPARSLAEAAKLSGAQHFFRSKLGGNMPQACVNDAAGRIARGEIQLAVIAGAEANDSLMKAHMGGFKLDASAQTDSNLKVFNWGHSPAGPLAKEVGSTSEFMTFQDVVHGLSQMPVQYAIVENALRIADGKSIEERHAENAAMFAAFSRVASKHDQVSWSTKELSAEEIKTTAQQNRMIAFPYNRHMCAVIGVNQAASVLITSERRAMELGVSKQQMVYLHGGADCDEISPRMVCREELHRCLGMKLCGQAALESANLSIEAIKYFDLYSCFPVAVRLAYQEMGIHRVVDIDKEPERLTVTGGLPFHGGPGNNYSMHAIVFMARLLREQPGAFGLINANGGILSKHAVGIYSTTPYATTHPDHPTEWRTVDCTSRLKRERELHPQRVVPQSTGTCEGSVKSFTLIYARDGTPQRAVAVGDILDGPHASGRFLAISENKATLQAILRDMAGFSQARTVALSSEERPGKSVVVTTFGLPPDARL